MIEGLKQTPNQNMSHPKQETIPSESVANHLREFRKKTRRGKCGAKEFGINALFWDASLSNLWATEQEIKEIHAWTKEPKHFIVVLGSPGTGKTYLCAALLNYFYDFGEEVFYITARHFFQKLQESMKENISNYSAITKFTDQEILIIDDLGAGTNTEWQQEMILELVDERYTSMKPTIITSNFDMKAINEYLGARTHSRLNARQNLIIPRWEADRR